MGQKVLIITGTRAEYGRLFPIIKAIEESEILELQLVVTGMHLLHDFGYTVEEIKKDNIPISAEFKMFNYGHDNAGMVKALGEGIKGFTEVVEDLKPDFILVLGDRGEALVGAIVGSHMNIPVIHMHGGEVTGSIDESIRHAITKFAHIHFAATEESAIRINKLGENPSQIYNVGSPGLDSIINGPFLNPKQIAELIGIEPDEKTILLIQHPVTSEYDNAATQMKETLVAIKDLGYKIIIIYPNADAGGVEMIKEIEKIKELPNIYAFSNLSHKVYLSLLKYIGVLVGNSSSGIMEAPSFGLPVVNIGTRQGGRERAKNIIDVDYNAEKIRQAIQKSLSDEEYRSTCKECGNPYGDGKTGARVVEILSNIKITADIISKKITY
ncbi:UDP-N-acetylglucosamine 2-epimerase [Bacillus anthracis]|uniref:UDP-N-acetylglucosamine 2-epimerase n=1 Tax=Bacillus anthracis TaxID=1392 RepID=UPI002DB90D08|nr:UDP-N-acetylglucosamine 2-epimerase [Bacillus anthracis]MEB9504392.1 UDP-N-acetylglucosamine 2-epimerase [Bacillus anthracis]